MPGEVAPMVAWVLERRGFTRTELDQAFPLAEKPVLDRFVQDMERMR